MSFTDTDILFWMLQVNGMAHEVDVKVGQPSLASRNRESLNFAMEFESAVMMHTNRQSQWSLSFGETISRNTQPATKHVLQFAGLNAVSSESQGKWKQCQTPSIKYSCYFNTVQHALVYLSALIRLPREQMPG